MRSDTHTNYSIRQKERQQDVLFKQQQSLKEQHSAPAFEGIDIGALLLHFWKGLKKLFVALKYQLSKRPVIETSKIQLPWFKLGLAALAIFILTKKDIHFSINMKAPLDALVKDHQEESTLPTTEHLSLLTPVNLQTKTVIENKFSLSNISDEKAKNYIKRFQKVAIAEMEKFGIPASIKIAQGLLESRAGTQDATITSNNHFGELMAGQAYHSAWENWRTHSMLLQENYPELFELGNNYKKWAAGFKKVGYTDDRNYEKYLIDIIKKYNLQEID